MQGHSAFFENFSVFENKTVFSNLAYPLKIRGEKFSEIKPKVDSVALDFGLYDVLEFKAKRLTEDQKRTVALARLFLRDAKFTLLDDPTAGFSKKASGEAFLRMKKAALKKAASSFTPPKISGKRLKLQTRRCF